MKKGIGLKAKLIITACLFLYGCNDSEGQIAAAVGVPKEIERAVYYPVQVAEAPKEIERAVYYSAEVSQENWQKATLQINGPGTKVKIEYPQLAYGAFPINRKINKQLYCSIVEEWYLDPLEEEREVEISYDIEYKDDKVISVCFWGIESDNVMPAGVKKGVTIDLDTGEYLTLEDFYAKEEIKPLLEKAMEEGRLRLCNTEMAYSEEEFLQQFIEQFEDDDSDNWDKECFYLSEDILSGDKIYFIAEPFFVVPGNAIIEWEVGNIPAPKEKDSYEEIKAGNFFGIKEVNEIDTVSRIMEENYKAHQEKNSQEWFTIDLNQDGIQELVWRYKKSGIIFMIFSKTEEECEIIFMNLATQNYFLNGTKIFHGRSLGEDVGKSFIERIRGYCIYTEYYFNAYLDMVMEKSLSFSILFDKAAYEEDRQEGDTDENLLGTEEGVFYYQLQQRRPEDGSWEKKSITEEEWMSEFVKMTNQKFEERHPEWHELMNQRKQFENEKQP